MTTLSVLAVLAFADRTVAQTAPPATSLDTAKIEQITGLKGALNAEQTVFKVSQPRTDVSVSVDGRPLEPFMGLTSWVAFTPGAGKTMAMGDLVLFQDEVNPVMSAALDAGLSVTALHNHFFYDDPRVYFMHVAGEGPADALAAGVKAALDKVKQVRAARPEIARGFGKPLAPGGNAISGAAIDALLGSSGQAKDGMFKVVFGRQAKLACGCDAGKDMGLNTWAAFAGTDQDALVDGDFAVLESELQAVLKSLRHDGIDIVAIHQHMTGETPRYLFLHYWGRGTARDLAQAVKNALSKTAAP